MKRKILYAVLSFIVSFGLWMYVVTVVSPEYEETFRNIKVEFVGESALETRTNNPLMRLDKKDYYVTLHLSGNRSDLTKLNSSNIDVTVDLSTVYEDGTQALRYDVSYPGNVSGDAITVVSREPSSIILEIVPRATGKIPVEIEYIGTLPENYMKEKPQELPFVTVAGPASEVSQIKAAKVQVDLTDVTEDIVGNFAYTLVDRDGEPVSMTRLTAAPQPEEKSIPINIPIKKIKQIPLVVDVIYGAGATTDNTQIVLDYEYIQVSGSDAMLEGIDQLVLGQIDLTKIVESQTIVFPIDLSQWDITNESGFQEVPVHITLPELATRTFKLTQITPVNVPQGMEATITAQEIDIVLRGVKTQLYAMTEEDITVTVDFAQGQIGTERYAVTITLNNRSLNVGVINTYTVVATLTPVE